VSEQHSALQRRREALQARSAAQREAVARDLDVINAGVARVDQYVAIARRMRPLLIVGGLALLVLAGPRRLYSISRSTLVGTLLARQLMRTVPVFGSQKVRFGAPR
jgi:YqjK-like protein